MQAVPQGKGGGVSDPEFSSSPLRPVPSGCLMMCDTPHPTPPHFPPQLDSHPHPHPADRQVVEVEAQQAAAQAAVEEQEEEASREQRSEFEQL